MHLPECVGRPFKRAPICEARWGAHWVCRFKKLHRAPSTCGDMRRLTIANGEQTAQLIVVNDFYGVLDRMREYQKQLDVLPSSFRVKLAELEGYVIEAKEMWRVKFEKRKRE